MGEGGEAAADHLPGAADRVGQPGEMHRRLVGFGGKGESVLGQALAEWPSAK